MVTLFENEKHTFVELYLNQYGKRKWHAPIATPSYSNTARGQDNRDEMDMSVFH